MLRQSVLLLARSPLMPRTARWLLLRACGLDVQTRGICARTVITGRDISIGRGSFINRGCMFDTSAPIRLGERVAVGMDTLFVTSTHRPGTHAARAGDLTAAPIVVGSGTWIGARATILPGVTVGEGCVIAAGAVVTGDCAPDGLYAGIPARRVKELTQPVHSKAPASHSSPNGRAFPSKSVGSDAHVA